MIHRKSAILASLYTKQTATAIRPDYLPRRCALPPSAFRLILSRFWATNGRWIRPFLHFHPSEVQEVQQKTHSSVTLTSPPMD